MQELENGVRGRGGVIAQARLAGRLRACFNYRRGWRRDSGRGSRMTTPTNPSSLLTVLETMPGELESAAARMTAEAAGTPPPDGGLSLVEQAWHLADLEREGYGER